MMGEMPTADQFSGAHAIVESVRLGPFNLADEVRRLTDIAELAVALLLADRDRELSEQRGE
jgi:hypothetical protein